MKGFTLIEIIVIMGVLGVIMIATTNILSSSFKARSRISVADVVEQTGTSVLNELKSNIINATGIGASCVDSAGIGTSLTIQNVSDGGLTTLVCYENVKIASESANGNFDLTPLSIKVSGCENFAKCEFVDDSTDTISRVNFWFNLSQGDVDAGNDKFVSRNFRSSIELRN